MFLVLGETNVLGQDTINFFAQSLGERHEFFEFLLLLTTVPVHVVPFQCRFESRK